MRLHELDAWLAGAGFTLDRQKGSHRQYYNARRQRLTVVVHGGAHSALNWRQIAAIRQDMERLTRSHRATGT